VPLDRWYRPLLTLPVGAVETIAGRACSVVVTDTDPRAAEAQWTADRSINLMVTDDVPAEELRTILPEFLRRATALADRPSEATVTFASRAVDRGRIARSCGFTPWAISAVADLRDAMARPGVVAAGSHDSGAPRVRAAEPGDAGAIGELWGEQADFEAQLGTMRSSPAIRASIAASVPTAIAGAGVTLVAEHQGSVVGAVVCESVVESAWAGRRLMLEPVAYLAMASITATARGSGIGSALVRETHARLAASGVAASVLHYSAYNPLSVPFWSRHGYRPLLTHYVHRLRD
jgi:predicted N-acetyltransferase YhbS